MESIANLGTQRKHLGLGKEYFQEGEWNLKETFSQGSDYFQEGEWLIISRTSVTGFHVPPLP